MWGLMSLCWNTINCGILKKFATKSQFTCGKTRPRLGQEYSSQTKTGPDQIILHSYCLVELQSLGQKKGRFQSKDPGHSNHINSAPNCVTYTTYPWESQRKILFLSQAFHSTGLFSRPPSPMWVGRWESVLSKTPPKVCIAFEPNEN